jgi:glycine oxidase
MTSRDLVEPVLPEPSSLDIVVIGGGIHGCAVARELARRGREVLVLEKSVPGAEASSVAGGILGPRLEADEGPLLEFGTYSLGLYPDWCRELKEESGVDVGFERSGGALLAFDAEEASRLEARALGSGGSLLEGAAVAAWEPSVSPSAVAALVFPDEAQVDPPSIMKALPIAAKAAGVRFVQDTVVRIESIEGAGWGLEEGHGGPPHDGSPRVRVVGESRTYIARHVVVAAGAWSSTLTGVGSAIEVVKPARGQIVELQTRTRGFRSVLFSERGYVLARADGRVLAGSTLEFVGYRKGVTARGLASILALALEMVPELAEAEVVAARSGFRPHTADHLPLIGRVPTPGLWVITGHYRNGILLAPGSAVLLADLLCGSPPGVDPGPVRPERYSRDS